MTNLKRTRSNLVKRLRKPRVFIEWNNGKIPDPLCTEAARCIEALEAENERLREALDVKIPRDVAEQVMEMGRVEWGATAEQTANQHIEGFSNSLRLTREHFNLEDVPVQLHGVYLAGTETILCHTGTSPNSGPNARILVGLWNRLYDEARAALEARHD